MSTTRLVLIHGRAQENKDSIALKAEWIDAYRAGLLKSQLPYALTEERVKFPYYGQALYDLVRGAATVAEVIVRGVEDRAEQEFQQAVIQELQQKLYIDDAEVDAVLDQAVKDRGVLNWEWVQGILQVVDQKVPGASSASIALATRDVYHYLKNPGARDLIERGVREAMQPGLPTVVVAHSLGTVVAYNLLRREGAALGWHVPLFVTLGSPLGVEAIRSALAPIEYPSCVGHWFNAMDDGDVVALYPLTPVRFNIDPPIENKINVSNRTPNRHGIAGYVGDKEVAARIAQALL